MTGHAARLTLFTAGALALLSAGCGRKEETPAPAPAPAPAPVAPAPAPVEPTGPIAIAELSGPEGSSVKGIVTFRDTGNGIAIEAKVSGLTPGSHGFHVHETGDCSGDFSAAGAHFNPGGHPHAGPDAAAAHEGDLGNLLAPADGNAQLTMLSRRFTLDDGPTGIIGRSVIVHEKEDDLATQPTGNSGARIACGVVKLQADAAAPAGDAAAAPAGDAAAPAGDAAAPAGDAAAPAGEPAAASAPSGAANH